jgi:Mg-chelatase subunit ChlD/DNA-binding beta-propeller fold protein YncE
MSLAVLVWGTVTLLFVTAPAQAQTGQAYVLRDQWAADSGLDVTGFVRDPSGIAVSQDGTAYVVDAIRGRVHVFRDGAFIDSWGEAGAEAGQLGWPHGIALLPDGRIAVADTGNRRIQLFDAQGTPTEAWSGVGVPWDVAVDPDGNLLVSDHAGHRLVLLDSDGRWMGSLGSRGEAWGELEAPTGLDVLPDGRIAVIDSGNQRLQVWSPDGSVVTVVTNTSSLPFLDVAALGDDRVVVAALRRLQTYALDQGVQTATAIAPVPGGFSGVAVQPAAPGAPTPSVWATVRHDDRTGIRRYRATRLALAEEWLDLPSPPGEFVSPRRIDVDQDAVYLLDAWPRVQRLELDGQPRDQSFVPLASEMAPSGDDVFIYGAGSVRRVGLLPPGEERWAWEQVTPTVWFAGLAYDQRGDVVYGLDIRSQSVRMLSGSGRDLGSIPLPRGAGASYHAFTDLALRPDGRLVLVNRTTKSIETRELDGRLVDEWQVAGVPLRAATDNGGHVFVLTREGWIWKLGPDGTVQSWWDAADQPDVSATPADLAVSPSGEVLVLDGRRGRVLVYARDPSAKPAKPPTGSGCTFVRDKWAEPQRILLGDTVGVTLTVSGECFDEGAGTDVMIVLDRSGSMVGRKMEAAKGAAIAFVGEMDFTVSRIGLVVFNLDATIPLSLTADAATAIDAIVSLEPPTGGTDIGEGIQLAHQELVLHGRPAARKVMVVMTDGRPESADVDADEAATAAKGDGIHMFSIGFGGDTDPELMRRIATSPEDYFFAPTPSELSGIYTEIARRLAGGTIAKTAVVTDVVPANMTYVVGSAEPPIVSYVNKVLRWEFAEVQGDLQMRYRLQPQQVGTWPTNVEARMRYVDGLDVRGEVVFPIPHVTVVGPAEPIYLPITVKHHCTPRKVHADVALVMDASSSMYGGKLDDGKTAARRFADRLDLPRDRATVISFNRSATVHVPLSGDALAIRSAIDSITIVPGTSIDAGLEAAIRELTREEASPLRTRVIVLLTDGRNNAGPAPVRRAARDATAHGIVLYTVALGQDADQALMREIAGSPSRAFRTLDSGDLDRIYQEIAGRIACP